MKRILNRIEKGIQELHRMYLREALFKEDTDYATTCNAMMRLIERLRDDLE